MDDTRFGKYYTYIKPVIGNKYVKSSAPYIFSLITIIILTVFAIKPTVITIISLQKNIQDNQKVLEALNQKSLTLTEGKRNLDNLDPGVKALITARLPNHAAVTTLISNLQATASKSASVSALQIQPVTIYTNIEPTQNLGEVLFSLNIQSSYAGLLATLDSLAKAPRLINITSVIMNKSKEEPVGLSVSGKAYYLK